MSAGCLLSIPKLIPLFRDSLEAATPKAGTVDVFAQMVTVVVVFGDNFTAVVAVFSQLVRYIAAYGQKAPDSAGG